MDNSFFRSNWNQPSRPRYYSPKVVSIPVHFVGSETARLPSALKIQKVFRGHRVRKSVKRIQSLKREVDEVERRISMSETIDLIRRDVKERLRVNETLMALLFKLDSVRGVDSGVRDCRKAVIRKAIALQERVDAIVAGDQQTLGNSDSDALAEAVDQTLEIKDSAENLADSECAKDQTLEIEGNSSENIDSVSVENHTPVTQKSANILAIFDNDVHQTLEIVGEASVGENVLYNDREKSANNSANSDDPAHQTLEIETEAPVGKFFIVDTQWVNLVESEAMPEATDEITKVQVSDLEIESPENFEQMDITEVGVDSEVKANEETSSCVVKQIVENHTNLSQSGCVEEESVETSPTGEYSLNPQSFVEGSDEENMSERREGKIVKLREGDMKDCSGVGGREDNKRNRELLERMMEDNEKMMGLMTQLCERNERQTRMLSSLSHRVEQLERAFICDKLKRKKNRHTA